MPCDAVLRQTKFGAKESLLAPMAMTMVRKLPRLRSSPRASLCRLRMKPQRKSTTETFESHEKTAQRGRGGCGIRDVLRRVQRTSTEGCFFSHSSPVSVNPLQGSLLIPLQPTADERIIGTPSSFQCRKIIRRCRWPLGLDAVALGCMSQLWI